MTDEREPIHPAEQPCAGTVLATGDARADLAQAMGLCEAGQRATAVVPGSELARVVDRLQEAVRRMLPLVVRAPLRDGHAGLFAIADAGAAVLLARGPAELPVVHLLARLLAERALLPVVVAVDETAPAAGTPAELPPAALELLGSADDFVPAATPAQELLFGAHRRRVVRWFDLERPVLRGQDADPALRMLQRAGTVPFVHSPVAELLQLVAAEVQRATGSPWSPATSTAAAHADVLVVGLGDATAPVAEALAGAGKKPRIGAVALHCLRPFADDWLATLRGKTAVIVLSAADAGLGGEPPLLREVRSALARTMADAKQHGKGWKDREVPALHAAIAGCGGSALQADDLAAFARECAGGGGRPLVWLGVEFAPLQGKLRKRLVLHEALRRGHPGLERLGLRTTAPAALRPLPTAPPRVPPPPRAEPTHDSLTRCWDVVAAAAVGGSAQELAPDPYLTAGSAPALSSLFRGNQAPALLPAFAPAKCTGCGACWTACPDGALLPLALGAADLLEAGVRRAEAPGQSAEPLRPVLARIAKALPKAVAAGAHRAGDAVRAAAGAVLEKADAERRPALQAAAAALAEALDPLPLALTEAFFHAPERQQPGTGSLFALALDADACKGCNLCVAVCKPEALRPEPFGLMAVERARATAALWRALPDTPGQILAAAQKLPEPGLLGALELSRHCLHALAPSDGAEPGSGARIALRTVLAVAEAHLQPQLQQHLRELDQLAAEFGARIRDLLAAALPAADLDALHEGLALLGMGAVALSSLATRLDEVSGSGRVDTARLQRLVETARALADLRFRIAEGSTGRGRARAGLVLAGGTGRALAGSFPWNPFAGPAVLDDGPDAAHRALGLLRGEAGALAQDFALLRRAKALLQPGAPGPRTLAFAELTAAERALCPPLLFVTGADSIARGGDAPLAAILASELPIKVLLLAETVAAPTQPAMPQCNPALMALAHRQAYVLQTSIAQQDHFAAGVLAALRHPGPALLHVLAPSPRRAGAAADQALRLAAAAVQSRAFPLFCHDPGKPGAFGEKLSLHGNPAPETAGTDDPMHLATWQTLQELAGIRTPFTVDVEQRAAAAVAEAHAQQLAELQARRIDELQQARAAVEQELLQRLQRKLVALAGGRRP